MPRRWVLPLICLYVVLVIVVIAWPGQRDVLATIVDFTTVYVLTWTLVAVWRYAELTHQQLAMRAGEWRVLNKPVVFLDADVVPSLDPSRYETRYVARNVGPGLAVNVHVLTLNDDGKTEDVDTIGAIEAGGSRVLPEHMDTHLEAHAGRLSGRVVVTEAMKTRTVQWVVTLNVADKRGQVRHSFLEDFAVEGLALSGLLEQHGQRFAEALAVLRRQVESDRSEAR